MSASVPITCIFRSVWPRDTAKHAALAAGMSHRTAQGWLSERFTPSAATLLRMADRNDKLRAELVRHLTGTRNESMEKEALLLDGRTPAPQGEGAGDERSNLAREG